MGSSQLSQVTDTELFIHISKLNRMSFLEIQRGKHRQIGTTAEEHLYSVLKFVKNGVILDDIDGPDSSMDKIGGPTRGNGGGSPFHQYDSASMFWDK